MSFALLSALLLAPRQSHAECLSALGVYASIQALNHTVRKISIEEMGPASRRAVAFIYHTLDTLFYPLGLPFKVGKLAVGLSQNGRQFIRQPVQIYMAEGVKLTINLVALASVTGQWFVYAERDRLLDEELKKHNEKASPVLWVNAFSPRLEKDQLLYRTTKEKYEHFQEKYPDIQWHYKENPTLPAAELVKKVYDDDGLLGAFVPMGHGSVASQSLNAKDVRPRRHVQAEQFLLYPKMFQDDGYIHLPEACLVGRGLCGREYMQNLQHYALRGRGKVRASTQINHAESDLSRKMVFAAPVIEEFKRTDFKNMSYDWKAHKDWVGALQRHIEDLRNDTLISVDEDGFAKP